MQFLRQATAQTVLFGPCLDKTDGVTEETALTLAQADMRLSKDGGAFAQKSAAGNATHDSDGWYSTSLSTTDTGTVGILKFNVHQPTNMLPVWETFYVLEELIYDALFAFNSASFTGGVSGRVLLRSVTHTGAIIPDVTLVATTTVNTDMRGTDNAALATVLGALADAAAADDPTSSETLMQYIKQLINILVGTTGAVNFPAGTGPGDGVSLAELIRQLYNENNAVLVDTQDIQSTLGTPVTDIAADIAAAAAATPKKNIALNDLSVLMVDSTDHVTPKTGLTLGVTRSIDGGAFGAGTGTAAELTSGMYQYDTSAADMNGSVIIFRFTGTAADDAFITIHTRD